MSALVGWLSRASWVELGRCRLGRKDPAARALGAVRELAVRQALWSTGPDAPTFFWQLLGFESGPQAAAFRRSAHSAARRWRTPAGAALPRPADTGRAAASGKTARSLAAGWAKSRRSGVQSVPLLPSSG